MNPAPYSDAASTELKVSRTPLREAINRLVSEGLLVADPRGVFARSLEATEACELYEARLGRESSSPTEGLEAATRLLAGAKNPVVVCGGGPAISRARAEVTALADRLV